MQTHLDSLHHHYQHSFCGTSLSLSLSQWPCFSHFTPDVSTQGSPLNIITISHFRSERLETLACSWCCETLCCVSDNYKCCCTCSGGFISGTRRWVWLVFRETAEHLELSPSAISSDIIPRSDVGYTPTATPDTGSHCVCTVHLLHWHWSSFMTEILWVPQRLSHSGTEMPGGWGNWIISRWRRRRHLLASL